MQRAAIGQARYSQVSLGPQAIQHVLDKELPLRQGQEDLHVVCFARTDTHTAHSHSLEGNKLFHDILAC